MDCESSGKSVRPFLTQFATPRSDGEELSGRFDYLRDVWVITTSEDDIPLALAGASVGDTSTGTFVQTEQDDTDMDVASLASTSTSTKVSVEGEDVDISCVGLLEVTTKTQAQIESEDVALTIDMLDPEEASWSSPVRRIQ